MAISSGSSGRRRRRSRGPRPLAAVVDGPVLAWANQSSVSSATSPSVDAVVDHDAGDPLDQLGLVQHLDHDRLVAALELPAVADRQREVGVRVGEVREVVVEVGRIEVRVVAVLAEPPQSSRRASSWSRQRSRPPATSSWASSTHSSRSPSSSTLRQMACAWKPSSFASASQARRWARAVAEQAPVCLPFFLACAGPAQTARQIATASASSLPLPARCEAKRDRM